MTERPNVFEPRFDAEQDRTGFRWRRARLGRQAGAERLGASLFELPPGQASFPFHYHLANEELLVVVEGSPTLRTAEGERSVAAGEVVSFPVGERGAHQIINRSDRPVRFLVVSEMVAPEVLLYPDTGKIGARDSPPGADPGEVTGFFLADDSVDYFEGEPEPE
jgi:uncharacterized cupin superfamily protein